MLINTKSFIPLYKEFYILDLPQYEIYPFFVQVGKKYKISKIKILFVGKSINGWVTNCRNVDNLFGQIIDYKIANRDDQMEWIHTLSCEKTKNGKREYNTNRSQFWQLIQKISLYLHDVDDWYNYIAWSNLYKFAPEKGNPNNKLKCLQKNICIEILKEEIKILNPNLVIFLTSGWEKDFIKALIPYTDSSDKKEWDSYKTEYKVKNDIIYIQSPHPQGKNISKHSDIIKEIIKTKY